MEPLVTLVRLSPQNQARDVLKETWSWVKVVLKVKGDMVLDPGQEFICREII